MIIQTLKKALFPFVSFVLYYTFTIKIINIFVNNFSANKNSSNSLVFPYIVRRRHRNFQVLVYHRVGDKEDPFFPKVHSTVFEKHMYFLSKHFIVLPLENAIELMKRNDLPPNAVSITFDDGYKDNYQVAFPILKSLSLPASIFLATESIGSGKVLWHNRVFNAFRETKKPKFIFTGNGETEYKLSTTNEKLKAQGKVLRFLKSINSSQHIAFVDKLVDQLEVNDDRYDKGLMLNWDEVRIMAQNGISFGAHTHSHPILSSLENDQAREEILKSKSLIEENLEKSVTTFAYPNGTRRDFNESTKQILRESGFLCALTTIFGTNMYGDDLFELSRGGPWETELTLFGLKMNWNKFID